MATMMSEAAVVTTAVEAMELQEEDVAVLDNSTKEDDDNEKEEDKDKPPELTQPEPSQEEEEETATATVATFDNADTTKDESFEHVTSKDPDEKVDETNHDDKPPALADDKIEEKEEKREDMTKNDSLEETTSADLEINTTSSSIGRLSTMDLEDEEEEGMEDVPVTPAFSKKEQDAKTEDKTNVIATTKLKTTTTKITTTTMVEPQPIVNEVSAVTMELNVAYEALEHVRQANVALEFGRTVGPHECIPCLRVVQQRQKELEKSKATRNRFQNMLANRPRPLEGRRATPCIACGTTVCPKHQCPQLRQENINICLECAAYFNLEEFLAKMNPNVAIFYADMVESTGSGSDKQTSLPSPPIALTKEERRQHMNQLLDVYDRALLVLQYSSRFIDDISTALERNTERNNKIGLGSSATGFVSGIAGVAAAATIWTPVGPPLLIASILFGGGATAVSASSESVNYRCSANKMADTIYALHGMVHSISSLTLPEEKEYNMDGSCKSNSLMDDSVKDQENHCDDEGDDNGHGMDEKKEEGASSDKDKPKDKKTRENEENKNNSEGGYTGLSQKNAPPRSLTPPQRKRIINNHNDEGNGRRNWTRATANALKPLTAGALSAASVVMEAREMRATLDKINAGNPCAKANMLRSIADEISEFPSTRTLSEVSPKYFHLQ